MQVASAFIKPGELFYFRHVDELSEEREEVRMFSRRASPERVIVVSTHKIYMMISYAVEPFSSDATYAWLSDAGVQTIDVFDFLNSWARVTMVKV